MVGHYWLRAPGPGADAGDRRRDPQDRRRHQGVRRRCPRRRRSSPPTAPRFTHVLSIGIGGSALGPMFVADALGDPAADRMTVDFIDNTDPDGIARDAATPGRPARRDALRRRSPRAAARRRRATACCWSPRPTRRPGLDFAAHAVAITRPGSQLDKTATGRGLARPLPDVRLGRRPNQRAVRGRPAAGGAARARHRRPARRRRRLRRGHATARPADATRPRCWP